MRKIMDAKTLLKGLDVLEAKTPGSHCRGPGFDPWSRN